MPFPERNECPGIHCSLIEQEEREDSSARSATELEIRGKMEERTARESDNRREEKWQTCWCCQYQQRAFRMAQPSAEKLEHTGPAEKERVATETAVGKNAGAAFAKRKRNRVVCPEYQIVRGRQSQGG